MLRALVISILVASNDPDLLRALNKGIKDAGASPFVSGIKKAGSQGLDHVVNAGILTSSWSAANSFLYAGSRSLYSMALDGQAPHILSRCRNGVPYIAVLFTGGLTCVVYLGVSSGSATVFAWFLNLTTIGGYIAWIVMFMAYIVLFLPNRTA